MDLRCLRLMNTIYTPTKFRRYRETMVVPRGRKEKKHRLVFCSNTICSLSAGRVLNVVKRAANQHLSNCNQRNCVLTYTWFLAAFPNLRIVLYNIIHSKKVGTRPRRGEHLCHYLAIDNDSHRRLVDYIDYLFHDCRNYTKIKEKKKWSVARCRNHRSFVNFPLNFLCLMRRSRGRSMEKGSLYFPVNIWYMLTSRGVLYISWMRWYGSQIMTLYSCIITTIDARATLITIGIQRV